MQFSGWAVFLEGNWNVESFVTNYLPFALFPVLYIGGKLWLRAPLVKLEEMDLVSGLKEIEAECYDEPPPRNWVERFWAWLVSSACAVGAAADWLPLLLRCKVFDDDDTTLASL